MIEKEEKVYSIYLFTFPNGKQYCGYTSRDPKKRWGTTGHNYDKCPAVHNAIEHYGWENIKKEVIFTSTNQNEAFAKEIEIIATLDLQNPDKGYNLDKGGRPHGAGDHLTEEGRKKISENTKAMWQDPEMRAYLMEERKGRKPTPQCIAASKIATSKRRKGIPPSNTLAVEQLDKNTGEKIAEFISASAAARAVMGEDIGCGNILHVCKGKRQTAYGYKWRFKQK